MRHERGHATVEAAVVIPLLVALAATLLWAVSTGTAKVRAVDAARDAARAVARGEDPARVVAGSRAGLPDDWAVRWQRSGDDVTVTIDAEAQAPSWLIVPLPDVDVTSSATVRAEPGVEAAP